MSQLKDQMQRRSAIARNTSGASRAGARKQRRQKKRELEQRRAMDLEGFTADVTTLRRLLSAVDGGCPDRSRRVDDDEEPTRCSSTGAARAGPRRGRAAAEALRRGLRVRRGRGRRGVAYARAVNIRSALGSVEDRLVDAARSNVSRDDGEEDDAEFVARVDPAARGAPARKTRGRR